MGSATGFENLERRIEEQFGLKRGIVMAVGIACLALGVLSIALPVGLYGTLIRLVGVLLFGSGAVKAGQLLIGRRSAAERSRSWPVIVCQVALDFLMGALLLNYWRASVSVATTVFGLLFLCEGLLMVYMALRSPTPRSRLMLALNGAGRGRDRRGDRFETGRRPDPLGWGLRGHEAIDVRRHADVDRLAGAQVGRVARL